MSALDAVRWSGVAAIVAAVLLLFEPLGRLFPDSTLSLFITISNVGFVFLIFALTGIGSVLFDEGGASGFIVIITGTVGAILLIADGVVAAYVYPVLDEETVVTVQGSLGLTLVSLLGSLTLLIAIVLLAMTVGHAESLPGRAAWLMLAGALLNALVRVTGSTTLTDTLALLAGLVFATGLGWLGTTLLSPASGANDV